MTLESIAWDQQYRAGLAEYLRTRSEAALYEASLLSRAFVEGGLGPDDIVPIHFEALNEVLRGYAVRDHARVVNDAHQFLLEVMIAYGIKYKEYLAYRVRESAHQAETRALQQHQRALDAERAEREKAEILERIADGFFAVDHEWRLTYVNRQVEELVGRSRDHLLGGNLSDCLPDPLVAPLRDEGGPAAGQGGTIEFEAFYPPLEQWFAVRAHPAADGLSVYFRDITQRKQAERERDRLAAAVEQERATLVVVMEGMVSGLVVLDVDGRVRYCNRRVGELLGIDPQLLMGKTAEEGFGLVRQAFAEPESAWAEWREALSRLEERPTTEATLVGSVPRQILGQFFPVEYPGGVGRGVGLLLRDVTDARRLAVLEERERIAMDLHDGAIQSLYAVGLGLAAHEHALEGRPERTREVLLRSVGRINAVIEDIRNYIFELHPTEPEQVSLRRGLEALADELRAGAGIWPELMVDPEAERLLGPPAVMNLLQLAREAASNVRRHARASRVQVALLHHDGQVVLSIRDDGRGFDAERRDGQVGQGLRNMAARAEAVGGKLAVLSQPGQGTDVRLEMPVRGDGGA